MKTKLTETELAILSAAMIRDDKCVLLQAKRRGVRTREIGEKLIEVEFVREIKAKASSPIWRRDDEADAAYDLKLTAAGVKAVKEYEAAPDAAAQQSENSKEKKRAVRPPLADRPTIVASPRREFRTPSCAPEPNASSAPKPYGSPGAPRPRSKIAGVVALLERETGATISDLTSATGWLPHTTRAALTGLRKRGYKIALGRADGNRDSIYRIVSLPNCPAAADTLVEAR